MADDDTYVVKWCGDWRTEYVEVTVRDPLARADAVYQAVRGGADWVEVAKKRAAPKDGP